MNGAGELVMGLVICATVIAASNWEIEIHFHQYNNPNGTKNKDRQCCAMTGCICEVEFRICLRLGSSGESPGCPYDDFMATTSNYTSSNSITFNDTINDLKNPIIFSSGGELKEVPASGLSLLVRVRDMGRNTDMLVDRVFAIIKGIGSSANSTLLIGEFGNVEFIISYDVRCQQNYYANDCSTHCLPSDDSRGHYNCDPSNGNKICLQGYQNPQSNCTQDLNPCSHLTPCENGGTCSNGNPNQYSCACPSGYTGKHCESVATSQTLQQDSLPVGVIIGGAVAGTVGLVVFATLLFLSIVLVLVLYIRRRAGTKVELSGYGDTGGIHNNPEENIYTLSSDEPRGGVENPLYDVIVSNQQRQPAAAANEEEAGEEPFQCVVDNDLYAPRNTR